MAGLADRSSRPRNSPRGLSKRAEAAILAARQASRYGPHRLGYLTGRPRSTCYAVRRRDHLNRLAEGDRVTGAPVLYVACHPGALIHRTLGLKHDPGLLIELAVQLRDRPQAVVVVASRAAAPVSCAPRPRSAGLTTCA